MLNVLFKKNPGIIVYIQGDINLYKNLWSCMAWFATVKVRQKKPIMWNILSTIPTMWIVFNKPCELASNDITLLFFKH